MNTTCKKTLFFMALAFMSFVAAAQSTCDVILLKDRTFVKGTIIEQIPNETLKVQTEDGKVHTIRVADIEKITKEEPEEAKRPSSHRRTSGGRALQRGYRGLVDAGFCLNTGYHVGNRMELSTSHGYQFTPHVFLGLGVGIHYFFESDKVNVPIFAHARYDFVDSAFTPFAELKAGYSAGTHPGFYLCPALGWRFAVKGRYGLNIGIGYTMQLREVKYIYYESGVRHTGDVTQENAGGFVFKAGFDF